MFNLQALHKSLVPLIASDTVSSEEAEQDQSNLEYCELLANQLEPLNFKCSILSVPEARQKWNLVAHRPGQSSQSGGLMFSGHSDTVPAQTSLWHQDPWQLKRSENHFSGLGVTDMKGFFAVLVDELSRQPLNFSFPITIIATADEETSMAGARALKSLDIGRPHLNIVGEPTSMTPIFSHKGYMGYRLQLTGPGGHSSMDLNHRNCIDAMQSVIQALIAFRQKLQAYQSQSHYSVPVTTLNLGTIKAGDAVNRICASAVLEFDIRPLPGMEHQQIDQWLKAIIEPALAGYQVEYQLSELYPPIQGFASSVSSEQQDHLESCCQCHSSTANYVTEAGFFERLGITTVVLGPGNIAQAHTANEWVAFTELEKAQSIYRQLMHKYCR